MREWIETNGLGSYASLTHQQTVSRKFHGLLVASLQPPVKRWLFVSNIYDTLSNVNSENNLWEKQPGFHHEWLPSFIYSSPSTELIKTVCMSYHQNTTILRYDFKSAQSAKLKHKVVINSRHFYDTTDKDSICFSIFDHKTGIAISPDNIATKIIIHCPHANFHPLEYWEETSYEIDKSRQDSSKEYQYVVGEFTHKLSAYEPYYLIITTESQK
ncbi:MAG: glycogen debranching enzyme N-terminal domain-containing protein, partial [Candidatus Thermoplasmatota archaeon]|nr:glycogen debranching enzyme N-terminal domain-containing protein [Candidatus Thermoplasmatota archaeon]